MKFGEALVGAGALDREQLAKALEMQKILGGRLGTNLLELGYLDEETLLEHLGRFRSTRTVSAGELRNIAAPVLGSVPRKLVLRYRMIPYQVRGKTLFVASKDPGAALKEDEISFLTSFMVRTSLALELHLEVALRKHFKAPLDQRFVALTRRLGGIGGRGTLPTSTPPAASPPAPAPSSAAAVSSVPSPAPSPAAPTPSPPPSRSAPVETTPDAAPPPPSSSADPEVEFVELDADDLALLRGSSAGPSAGPGDEAPSAAVPSPEVPVLGEGILDRLEAERSLGEASADGDIVEAEPEPDWNGMEPPPESGDVEERLAWAARQLQAADIRDEIGDVLLAFSAAFFRRRALVIRRKEQLVGWMAAGDGEDAPQDERFAELALDTVAPSVFFGLKDAGSFWLGPLPMLPANRSVTEHLGGPPPKDCLVLPVSLRSKIVGYLYVDNGEEGVAGAPVAEMKRLVAKAGLAFEVYILKNKIRTM